MTTSLVWTYPMGQDVVGTTLFTVSNVSPVNISYRIANFLLIFSITETLVFIENIDSAKHDTSNERSKETRKNIAYNTLQQYNKKIFLHQVI